MTGRRSTGRRAAGVACAQLVLAACAGSPPGETAETRGEADGGLLAAHVDARYLTHLLFTAADGTAFVGAFDQTAEGESLRRDYDVRVSEDDAWRSLVSTRDTLPVARAAWRVLPTPGMSVRVGDAGQVVSLRFHDPAGADSDSVRLLAGEEVAVWTGPTGQRESLGVATLHLDERVVPGILFFRRAARTLQIPVATAGAPTFVFADSLGNGLVAHTGDQGQPAVAYTWLHGIEADWGDVTLEPAASGPVDTWRFEIPGTTVRGSFRPVAGGGGATRSVTRMEATLYVGTDELRLHGLTAFIPSP